MIKPKPRKDLPAHVSEQLKELLLGLGFALTLPRYERAGLSKREVQLIEREATLQKPSRINSAYLTLQVVALERGVSLERALLELSRSVDLLSNGRYEILRH